MPDSYCIFFPRERTFCIFISLLTCTEDWIQVIWRVCECMIRFLKVIQTFDHVIYIMSFSRMLAISCGFHQII